MHTLFPSLQNKTIGILGNGHLGWHVTRELASWPAEKGLTVHQFTRHNLHEIEKHEFDFFLNCAGTTGDYRSRLLETVEANLTLSVLLLRKLKVKEAFVSLSSSRIYGFYKEKEKQMKEEDAAQTNHLELDFIYDGSKKLMECLLLNYAPQVNYRMVLLRLGNVYGKFFRKQLNDSTLLKLMIRHALEKTPATIRHPEQGAKDYLWIDDAVEGILRAAVFSHHTSIYNLGSGRSYTLREWCNWLGLQAAFEPGGQVPLFCNLSMEKANSELQFFPRQELTGRDQLVID